MAATKSEKPLPLVGLFFHVLDGERLEQRQGVIQGVVNPDHAIVQFFEWFRGAPDTIEIVPVAAMATGATPSVGAFARGHYG
jgi:hypothetical protein